MSSHRVGRGLATILATAICLPFLGRTLIGAMTYRDPLTTKAEAFIHMQRQMRRSPPVTFRP